MFLNPNIFFSNLNSNCSNLSDMRNLQEKVNKAFCYQKLIWPFAVWIIVLVIEKKNWNLRLKAENLQKNVSAIRTIFSHRRSEQLWQQNIICSVWWTNNERQNMNSWWFVPRFSRTLDHLHVWQTDGSGIRH